MDSMFYAIGIPLGALQIFISESHQRGNYLLDLGCDIHFDVPNKISELF